MTEQTRDQKPTPPNPETSEDNQTISGPPTRPLGPKPTGQTVTIQKRTLVIAAGTTMALVIAAGAFALGRASADQATPAPKASASPEKKEGSKATAENSAPPSPSPSPSQTGPAGSHAKDVEISGAKFDSEGDFGYSVTTTNSGKKDGYYDIEIEAVDKDGSYLAEDDLYVNRLGPGKSSSEKSWFTETENGEVGDIKSVKIKSVTYTHCDGNPETEADAWLCDD